MALCRNPIYLPKQKIWANCGQCISCKKSRARDWGTRMQNEYYYWKGKAAFITLTYDDDHIPANRSLNRDHTYELMHQLRTYTKLKLKYFLCGEYGKKTDRPHYHMILYGLTPEQICKWFQLKKIWKFGSVDVGYNMGPACMLYVAQYTLEKMYHKYYEKEGRVAPYMSCSRGIGKQYALDHAQALIDKGYQVFEGYKYGLPRYYHKIWDIDRAAYYKEQIAAYTNDLVDEARKAGIAVFEEKYDNPTFERYSKKNRLTDGRWIIYQGTWRAITDEMHLWIWSKRQLYDMKLRAKQRGKREVL